LNSCWDSILLGRFDGLAFKVNAPLVVLAETGA
jgi:hypothetical protein